MDENHQGKTGNKQIATEEKLWIPPLSPKEQKKVEHIQKKSFAERRRVAGKTPWDLVQPLLIPLILAAVGFGFTYWQIQIAKGYPSSENVLGHLVKRAFQFADDQAIHCPF